jgi:hypothetical protein
MSILESSLGYPVTTLFDLTNFTIGAGLQTGSASIAVTSYDQKLVVAILSGSVDCSGSIVVSGSADGSNWFQYSESSLFASGSGLTASVNVPLKYIEACLKNYTTGSAVSGSLWLLGRV